MRDVTPDPYPPFDGVEPYGTIRSLADERAHRKRMCALGYRIFRGVDNPNEVYIHIEFASVEHAEAARKRLVESGVLNRFGDTTGPTVVVEAEAIGY